MDRKAEIPVLVTGFGPFGIHEVNISWEVAKTLKTLDFKSLGIELQIEEIPVVYSIVTNEIPALWKKYKPQLVVHMGVTSVGSEMTLELVANKNGYNKVDILGKLPEKNSANGEKDVLFTKLNVLDVADYISNSTEFQVPIVPSTNAGRYLCEFTYYNSLNIDSCRSVFVHIPNYDKGYTVKEIAFVVKKIILLLLEQIHAPKQVQTMMNEITSP